MIEVAFYYDFIPGYDEDAYAELVKRATMMMVEADGFVEFRAHRNILGSPHVRRTTVWANLEAWARFAQNPEFQEITAEFGGFVTNLDVQLWGQSPLSPEPIKTAI